jgi:hypothetical protein
VLSVSRANLGRGCWRHSLAPGLVIYAFINRGWLKIKNAIKRAAKPIARAR